MPRTQWGQAKLCENSEEQEIGSRGEDERWHLEVILDDDIFGR